MVFLSGWWVQMSLPRLGSFLHAWNAEEWSGDTKKYLSGLDAQLAAPGGPTGYAHAWNEDAEPRPWNETTSAMSSPWPMSQLPQHLPRGDACAAGALDADARDARLVMGLAAPSPFTRTHHQQVRQATCGRRALGVAPTPFHYDRAVCHR